MAISLSVTMRDSARCRSRKPHVVVAADYRSERQFGVEIFHDFARRLEQLELQPAAETRLIDVHQQRVHLRLVRQLLQQRAERVVDFAQLLAVKIKVDRLLFLALVLVLELISCARPAASSST